jgi:LysM repeat protein
MERGLDLSHYNAVTDAHAVRAAGYTFAWCKATQGISSVDSSFAGKVAQLRAAGLVVGAYHFLDGTGNPAAQGRHFRAVAGDAGCFGQGALAPMLDLESSAVRASANADVDAFYDALGAAPMVCYGNLDWWTNVLRPASWGARGIIGHIARYTAAGNPGYDNERLGVQQYSDTGHVAGIPGAVDLDVILAGHTLASLTIGGATSVPAPTGAVATAPADNTDTWTVKAGDTLSRIASAWRVTVAELAAVNGIPNPDFIVAGQVIHRPGSASAAPAPVAGSSEYVVRAGDTLSGIAAAHATTVAVLVTLNHVANPDRITGEVLHLPTAGSATPTSRAHAYTVLPGDTLGVIAARLHVPGGWPTLAARNHLANPNLIRPGQTLIY